ncbi:MAG TPA: response regulator [Tepidisphaeraceae bacterium]
MADAMHDDAREDQAGAEALRVLLDLVPVGVVVARDRECTQLSANAAAVRMLGREPRAIDLPLLAAALDSGQVVRGVKINLLRGDGSPLKATASASPVRNGDGQSKGCVLVFTDDAEEGDARAEQFRELALALAEAEAHERKRLAQLLHDDFQQLISAAKLKAGIVRRLAASDERVRAGAQQIEQLLETTISASRSLISELSPPVLYDGGLVPAIEALARALQRQHEPLRIATRCDPRAEPEAEQVRVLLFEAVRELLHNVIRHSGATFASVTTGLRRSDGQIQIEVLDDGGGFDPTELPSATAPKRPFGLVEIRERLRWLGGAIEVTSLIGKGTRVRLTVPAAVRPVAASSTDRVTEPPSTTAAVSTTAPQQATDLESPLSKTARILVADDHAMFREGLISLLKHEPAFEVVGEAADGQEAVELARSLKPDILLVDVSMPKMSGLEVTSRLSREMPHMRIVGLSMHERQDMAAAMRAAGAAAYLTKDGSSETLLGLLRTFAPHL